MIRRLFAFMFRHDYAVDPKRVRILHGSPMTTLVCKRCGSMIEYQLLDREQFRRIYTRRGCPGGSR